jgi:hypothetical protein
VTRVIVGRRFNGPTTSANGGYACGVAAGFVEGPAEVALRAPVPLDTPLEVEDGADGGVVLRAGELVVATARAATEPPPQPPVRPSVDEARAAVRDAWRGRPEVFAGCYVCSPDRPDGLGVDFGRLPGRRDCTAALLVAGQGVPERDGAVAREIVWGALDCPSYTPALWELERPSLLAGMRAALLEPVAVGSVSVVVGWPLGSEGRKHRTASALLAPDGRLLAHAEALWITPRG